MTTLRRSRLSDGYRQVYMAVLSALRQMFSSRQRTQGHRKKIQSGAPAEG